MKNISVLFPALLLSFSLIACSGEASAADHGHGDHGSSAAHQGGKSEGMKQAQDRIISTSGEVVSIDGKGKATLTHEPMPSLNMPAMTMRFTAPPELLEGLKPGDKVRFDFRNSGNESILLDIEKKN